VSVAVDDADEAHRLAHAVVHGQAVPAAVEVDWPATGPGHVHVLLEGRPDGVAGRARTVRELLGSRSTESEEPPSGWASYPWDEPHARDATALKLTFVLSGLGEVLATARATGVHLRGSAGTGVVLASHADAERVPAAVEQLRAVCVRRGGSTVVLDGPAEVKRGVDQWGPVPALDLMRSVKDRFDPDHRLSPGRFVGGI
jgi:glycolate oxidase FAD binding subunit